jgi:hypothetical protein
MTCRVTPIILFAATAALAGCYETATKSQLEDKVVRLQGNSFPARLILERSDSTYDYYRVEADVGVPERYRVRRDDPGIP